MCAWCWASLGKELQLSSPSDPRTIRVQAEDMYLFLYVRRKGEWVSLRVTRQRVKPHLDRIKCTCGNFLVDRRSSVIFFFSVLIGHVSVLLWLPLRKSQGQMTCCFCLFFSPPNSALFWWFYSHTDVHMSCLICLWFSVQLSPLAEKTLLLLSIFSLAYGASHTLWLLCFCIFRLVLELWFYPNWNKCQRLFSTPLRPLWLHIVIIWPRSTNIWVL